MTNRQQRRDADFDIKKYIKASNEIEGIYSEEEDAQSLLAWLIWTSAKHYHTPTSLDASDIKYPA